MENGPDRAAFWADFILTRCEYPAPALLREQLVRATFTEFCPCGCNSFGVRVQSGDQLRLLALPKNEIVPGSHGAIFEADFRLADGKTLEIIAFANDEGNLDYIEVDCNANSEPVPDEIVAPDRPFHIRASASLNKDP